MPPQQLTEVPLENEYPPLLVLRTSQVLAGFGVWSNRSDPNKIYTVLYEGFKKKYYEHQGDWDDLDPAFVFCVSPDVPGLEQFGTRVETDVYFCRKFVVPLNPPLKRVLAHLPFLPLTSLAGTSVVGDSLRPPSAQTTLRRSGMSARLAEHLVVQGRSSPNSIVNACIRGIYGEAKPISSVDDGLVSVEASGGSTTQIRSITIKSFRAYQTETTFTLGDKLTVFYGPNGFGKTSIFDAIDFAVTGSIGRLAIKGNFRFTKAAAHLDDLPENSTVSLSLEKNGEMHKIVRSVSNRMRAKLDRVETNRKGILSFLTGGNSEHVENFVRLFRSTHLFSQERPDLVKDFNQNCTLPMGIVSRILSFEDYSNALSKISDVQRVINNKLRTESATIEMLKQQLAKAQGEFESFRKVAQYERKSTELDQLTKSLSRRVSDVGVEVLSDRANARDLASWRSILTARSETVRAKISRWSDLIGDASELPTKLAQVSEIQEKIDLKSRVLKRLTSKQESIKSNLDLSKQKVTVLGKNRSGLEARIQSLSWLSETAPLYERLLRKQKNAMKRFRELSETAAEFVELDKNALQNLNEYQVENEHLSIELRDHRARHATVQNIIEALDQWMSRKELLLEILEEMQSKAGTLNQLRDDVRNATDRREEFTQRDIVLSHRIHAADKMQSEVEGLVSQIQRYLQTAICPVCGQDHGSLEALLHRIKSREKPDSASTDRIELGRVRAERRKASDDLARLEIRQKTVERELRTLRDRRGQILSKNQVFEKGVQQIGVNPSDPLIRQQLIKLRDALMMEVAKLEEQKSQKRKDVAAATKAKEEAEQAAEAKSNQAVIQEQVAIELQKKIERLVDDPRLGHESIDLPVSEIADRMRTVRLQLSRIKDAGKAAAGDLELQKGASERVEQEAATLRADLLQLQNTADFLGARCRDISARFRAEGLPNDVGEKSLRSRIARLESQKARLDGLQNEVKEVELAVDEAATRAAFMGLRKRIGEQKRAVAEAQASQRRTRTWQALFTAASGILSKYQGLAVSHFTENYGPHASVIQRRLRSVPGFDDIEVTSEESAIRVRAIRQKDKLRPTDYFSQSQQQTLLLGLFLSACLSQTWSSFSPILLDDPVTHCDDLNAYAFLDLLAGLTESGLTGRQVVISTCDDRLLNLARRKFRHLGSEVKYYTLTAIGKDGPVVLPLD